MRSIVFPITQSLCKYSTKRVPHPPSSGDLNGLIALEHTVIAPLVVLDRDKGHVCLLLAVTALSSSTISDFVRPLTAPRYSGDSRATGIETIYIYLESDVAISCRGRVVWLTHKDSI